jgi:hypothetical protein
MTDVGKSTFYPKDTIASEAQAPLPCDSLLKQETDPFRGWKAIVRSQATNEMAFMVPREKDMDQITGLPTIIRNAVALAIKKNEAMKGKPFTPKATQTLLINADKLMKCALIAFARANSTPGKAKNEAPSVYGFSFSLADIANRMGYTGVFPILREDMTPDEIAKEKKRANRQLDKARAKISPALHLLRDAALTFKEKRPNEKELHDWEDIGILGRAGIRNGYINMELTVTMGTYLYQCGTLSRDNCAGLRIDDNHPNAYREYEKMTQQWNNPNNWSRGTNNRTPNYNRLKAKTLLAVSNRQTFDELRQTDRGHWRERLKESLENDLEYLVKIGLLKTWSYDRPDEHADFEGYHEWEETVILFEIADGPDYTQYLEARAEKAATAAAAAAKKKTSHRKRKTAAKSKAADA